MWTTRLSGPAGRVHDSWQTLKLALAQIHKTQGLLLPAYAYFGSQINTEVSSCSLNIFINFIFYNLHLLWTKQNNNGVN